MAGIRALQCTCDAIADLLRERSDPAQLGAGLEFAVYTAADFAQPMTAAVSVLLHRVTQDGTRRDARLVHTLHDAPVLTAAALNRRLPGVFADDEHVQLAAAELATSELCALWRLLGAGPYQLSLPYTARGLAIDS